MTLEGRVCVVTGATRGLGKRIACRLWRQRASLFLVARDSSALTSFGESLRGASQGNQEVVTFASDLSLADAPRRIVSSAIDHFGAITALINNAGIIGPIGPLWQNDFSHWQQTIRVNFLSPVELCALAVPLMQERCYGKIVNLSGGGATGPRPYFSAYASAKVALVRLTEVLAHETREMHIDVNCIAPGMMATGMLEEIKAAGSSLAGTQELATIQQKSADLDKSLDRAADLAAFLVSAESDGITGRLISAVWDPWQHLSQRRELLRESDIYTLRRIVPQDRGLDWSVD